jgi:hypothetical protein
LVERDNHGQVATLSEDKHWLAQSGLEQGSKALSRSGGGHNLHSSIIGTIDSLINYRPYAALAASGFR